MTRGFLLGKFMPPHAGHQFLVDSARAMVDELTILVCWLPDDPIPGPLRLRWMREMAPGCRVIGHDGIVPQTPDESDDFWPIWREIVGQAHPEPIDYLFAGEAYGLALARQVGGRFVPLGARVLSADREGVGGVSGSAIRADLDANWRWLPTPVRAHFTRTVVLHGVESTGKSTLAERLARHYDTLWIAEYGRAHAETHGLEMDEADLLLIGEAQTATIAAGRRLANRLLFSDTDALMTAAWAEMMIGYRPPALMAAPKADLYLMMDADTEWVHDGTRIYGDPATRTRFDGICRNVLAQAGVDHVTISGDWDERFARAVAAIDALPSTGTAFDLGA